jgi:putative molybdopterin biosynthesis protein
VPEYLTTREVAELLRLGERKVYDLAAQNAVPHVRAFGKLLFPRAEITAWLAAERQGPAISGAPLPGIVAGSNDPWLDWALRESGSGLASYCDGSFDGLERLAARQAQAAGLHIREPDGWNVDALRAALGEAPVVLIELMRRERGLLLAPSARGIDSLADLAGRKVVLRQESAASRRDFEDQLAGAGLTLAALDIVGPPARSEEDLAVALHEGRAEAGYGLGALSGRFGLGFLALTEERFDLAIWRRAVFEAPMQTLLRFLQGPEAAARAADLGGYDLGGLGRVHHNGAAD